LSKTPRPFHFFTVATIVSVFGVFGLSNAAGLNFEQLQQALISKFGPGQMAVFAEWRQMLSADKTSAETEKLQRANDFFNRRLIFDDDISIWGQPDYWATPMETLGRGRADCEDFAIAKYFSLINLEVPVNKLRLVYVKALQNGPTGPVRQAHMVLAYYATPNADPLVLDNLNINILPASQRTDLSPIFSFNSAGLWQGTGNQASKSNLSRWQDLLARARAEGFQ
jgi:predicted transglutaminase-like cysteine proteinase